MNNNLLVKQTIKSFTQIYDVGTNIDTKGYKQSLFERSKFDCFLASKNRTV